MNISVIIPVYNAAPFVEKAVESALKQPEVKEILLIEDGSIDNSLDLCQKLARGCEKIKLMQHPNGENKGAGASRNVGLENITQDFIAFLDADDYFLPHRFNGDKEIFKNHPNADGVFNAIGTQFYSENSKSIYRKKIITTLNNPNVTPESYFFELTVGGGFTHLDGITIKRSSLKPHQRFDEDLRQSQDTDLILTWATELKMYPGSMVEPVSMRGVHDNNRIHNYSEADYFGAQLHKKWLEKVLRYNWDKSINYKIFYRYVNSNFPVHRRQGALLTLIKNAKILGRVNIKDLLYGFKTNFN